MQLEILHGRDAFLPEYLRAKLRMPEAAPARVVQQPKVARNPEPDGAIPEPTRHYSDLYSNKHQKLLLRSDHIEMMDAIRRRFNKSRLHAERRSLTTSDIVNACLDFVMEHRIPFDRLANADDLPELIGESVYRSAVSRWRQFNEVF